MLRFNPWALALAFGVAKAVVAITAVAPLSWMIRETFLSRLPFGMAAIGSGYVLASVLWNFVGGVIAGGLFALIYNKVADFSAARAAPPST